MKKAKEVRGKMVKLILICFSGLTLFFACAGTVPKIHQFENRVIFEGSFDEVWSGIIEAFAEANIPIANMEKASGFISTQEMRVPSGYADCGSSPIGIEANTWGVVGSFNVFVKEASSTGHNVTINVRYISETNRRFVCTSTGELENWFMATLRNKLNK